MNGTQGEVVQRRRRRNRRAGVGEQRIDARVQPEGGHIDPALVELLRVDEVEAAGVLVPGLPRRVHLVADVGDGAQPVIRPGRATDPARPELDEVVHRGVVPYVGGDGRRGPTAAELGHDKDVTIDVIAGERRALATLRIRAVHRRRPAGTRRRGCWCRSRRSSRRRSRGSAPRRIDIGDGVGVDEVTLVGDVVRADAAPLRADVQDVLAVGGERRSVGSDRDLDATPDFRREVRARRRGREAGRQAGLGRREAGCARPPRCRCPSPLPVRQPDWRRRCCRRARMPRRARRRLSR